MPKQPRWREIAEDLRDRIGAGEFKAKAGRDALPIESDLEAYYEASRNTVRTALKWLADQRLVVTEAGKGSFVAFRPDPFHVTLSARGGGPGGGEGTDYTEDARVQGLETVESPVKVETQFAEGRVARYLKLTSDDQVVLRHQSRTIADKVWSLQTSYYPLSFMSEHGATKLIEARNIPKGVVNYLETTLGIKQVGYHDEIKVRPPNAEEASIFGLPDNGIVPVYETFRTAYDADGNPFRFTVTIWPADRNRLHYNVGEVPPTVIDAPAPKPSSTEG